MSSILFASTSSLKICTSDLDENQFSEIIAVFETVMTFHRSMAHFPLKTDHFDKMCVYLKAQPLRIHICNRTYETIKELLRH